MKRISEIIWELALAVIAFAGAFTLLSNYFPDIPSYIYGIFFLIAFIILVISFILRIYTNLNPVRVHDAEITFVPSEKPCFHIMIDLTSNEYVNIGSVAALKLEKRLEEELKKLVNFHPMMIIKTLRKKNKEATEFDHREELIIALNPNEYLMIDGSMELEYIKEYNKDDLIKINFKKYKVKAIMGIFGYRDLKITLNWS